jgi:hypothetical protein
MMTPALFAHELQVQSVVALINLLLGFGLLVLPVCFVLMLGLPMISTRSIPHNPTKERKLLQSSLGLAILAFGSMCILPPLMVALLGLRTALLP